MCDDHEDPAPRVLTRRHLLQGLAALAVLAGCAPGSSASSPRPRARSLDGLTSYLLAMHLHASASEGIGSMHAQLLQAARNGFDVAWFSEHDWRRQRLLFRQAYHFLPEESDLGGIWRLPRLPDMGTPTGDSGGGLVSTPVSPHDDAPAKGSLRIRVTGKGGGPAVVAFQVDSTTASRQNYRARITGRTVSIDVLPLASGPGAWGEVQFRLSRHPGHGSRPDGQISMRYRLRSDVTSRSVRADGARGVVDVPVTPQTWNTVTIDLTSDVHAVWPDIDPRDNSLYDIQLRASSSARTPAEFCFGHLRFDEQSGYDGLAVEHELLAAYRSSLASVLGLVGTEISLGPHLNHYGGTQAPFPYQGATSLTANLGDIRPAIVDFIHAHGGVASINHPFKPSDATLQATASAIALDLLSVRAAGADVLEVGYADKGDNGSLPNHLAVWDTLSRNAVFLTGTGVSDDHTGDNWANLTNRFYTGAFATGRTEGDLAESLRRGRAYVGRLGSFQGTVDMAVDTTPMGSVLVARSTAQRTLRLSVTGVPAGGAVQVLRGVVDHAGTASPKPNTRVVKELGASDLKSRTTLSADAGDPCFYRVQVVDRSGAVVAFGQPVWLLHEKPATGVPAARLPA